MCKNKPGYITYDVFICRSCCETLEWKGAVCLFCGDRYTEPERTTIKRVRG